MQNHKYILSAIGIDKPGIVAALTKSLLDLKCNIEGSTMTLLQGEFAVLLVLSIDKDLSKEQILGQLSKDLKQFDLMVNIRKHEQPVENDHQSNLKVLMISVYGADKPGIIHSVTQLLAENNINITDVETKQIVSTDSPSYVMLIEANILNNISTDWISSRLKILSKKIQVEITVQEVELESL